MAQALNIALVSYLNRLRGNLRMLELALALHQAGHLPQVFVLARPDDDRFIGLPPLPFPVHWIPARPCPFGLDELHRQRIQELVDYLASSPQSYDIYHAQDLISANALAALRGIGHIPHFIHSLPCLETMTSPYLRGCQERAIYEPDLCICLNRRLKERLKVEYGINAQWLPPLASITARLDQSPESLNRRQRREQAAQKHLILYQQLIEREQETLNHWLHFA